MRPGRRPLAAPCLHPAWGAGHRRTGERPDVAERPSADRLLKPSVKVEVVSRSSCSKPRNRSPIRRLDFHPTTSATATGYQRDRDVVPMGSATTARPMCAGSGLAMSIADHTRRVGGDPPLAFGSACCSSRPSGASPHCLRLRYEKFNCALSMAPDCRCQSFCTVRPDQVERIRN